MDVLITARTRAYNDKWRAKWRCLVCDGVYLRTEIELVYSSDVDPVSVERLVDGDRPERATTHEAFLAVAHLTVRRGWGILRIAEHTGLAPRNVSRYRRKIRLGQSYGSTKSA